MRYTINLRMKNPGVAKYLVESAERETMNEAFTAADELLSKVDHGHFAEVLETATGEKIAGFNEGGLG